MMHIKQQTYEEKFDMYMKCDKEELVQMLISANNHIDNLKRVYVDESGSVPNENIKRPINEIIRDDASKPKFIPKWLIADAR